MSDEESFVILGSSPMPSLENDGSINGRESSLQSDTPGSRFSSLKNGQITELQSAREISTQTPTPPATMEQSAESKLWSIPLTPSPTIMEQSTEINLWSRPPAAVMPLSLEDCALKSHMQQSLSQGEKGNLHESLNKVTKSTPSSLNTPHNLFNSNGCKEDPNGSSLPKTTSVDNNLAASFVMGDVNVDVLKSSVYSQFPSICMEACAEDVVKLQNMVTEYMQLKSTLQKVNNTMKLFYTNSMQWKEKMNQMENHYNRELNECQNQIEMLRKENQEFKQCFEAQYEQTKALDVARQKDREETVQEISEKNALLENMRAQIVKLEQQQLATFEVITRKQTEATKDNFEEFYVTRGEHELKIKDLERKLSELLASNLDLKDVEKHYIDELNCLKVNLTAAEEIIKQHRAEIASSLGTSTSFVAAAAAAQTYVNNPQRRIRVLTPQSANSKSASAPSSAHCCPICNKAFKSLNVLQSHVNDCIDKN